ncbi:pre-mRNA processing factor 3-domain-containing protein, partial [Scheffersomyces amazonensis]|uniref:pre-mRNA processing factor 3-domain-containing protein n=1 Tax=Scheffersomyces amazonensis TaxID=1078765 RepID=UPI00315CDAC8
MIGDVNRVNADNDIQPVSIYIQHPVLIKAPWLNHEADAKPMMLTKKEMKRIRRNTRQELLKDKQDRIKLGLDPPPPPKVKLSNLMNVLTNEAIKDPTSVEIMVKQQVEERLQKHLQTNEERKLTKLQKHEKIHAQHEKDIQKGYHTVIFRVHNLENGQHRYKIDINAKQCELVGICLQNPRFNLVIVEGGEKSIKFYKKLMMNRIQWDQSDRNKCDIVWEGQLLNLNFQKWSFMHTSNDEEAIGLLEKFGLTSYWSQSIALD